LPLDEPARRLLVRSIDALGLSLRAYGKVIKVARTIADLAAAESVSSTHVAEAIQYRLLDRDDRSLSVAQPSAAVRTADPS